MSAFGAEAAILGQRLHGKLLLRFARRSLRWRAGQPCQPTQAITVETVSTTMIARVNGPIKSRKRLTGKMVFSRNRPNLPNHPFINSPFSFILNQSLSGFISPEADVFDPQLPCPAGPWPSYLLSTDHIRGQILSPILPVQS